MTVTKFAVRLSHLKGGFLNLFLPDAFCDRDQFIAGDMSINFDGDASRGIIPNNNIGVFREVERFIYINDVAVIIVLPYLRALAIGIYRKII